MNEPQSSSPKGWRPAQAYVMAVLCLLIGLPVGYFVRGSAQPASAPKAVSAPGPAAAPEAHPAVEASAPEQKMPTLEDMKRMGDKQAEPLLAQLQKKPKDAALLNQVGLTYKATHQFEQAAEYFKKSLQSDPKNIAVRADYATCLYYTGKVDEALEQLQKALTYDPKHPGTLYNIGLIKLKGKGDVDGAVAAWQQLLKSNPDLPQKANVERMIAQAEASKGQVTAKDQNQPPAPAPSN